ncbi:hypothetical protein FLJC2902T_03900 [Flavobacterium limnosediminis JC2902]|uniref:Uncharacterized protein n=1 Tax=Flavobacterium limnosediminis JC2902 TaxID=1341181 RepID=V6SZQ9_9FLAO|nr:hypothetical protein [Flavobacterium limnosediminis]ESU29910.1 hypothetical protein FLJC2902T_03900 [Flavobacterium limnosediminis JC2902]
MKKNYFLLLLLIPSCFLAQVGINTNTPQQGLHVAGSASTVKIDGLSYPANTNNLGPGSVSRVFVNANGDLILGTAQNNIAILFDSENYLNDPKDPSINQITQHGYGDGFDFAGIPRDIPNSTFTLTQPAIIEINYSVSFMIEKNGSNRVNDGYARAVQTLLYFRSGNYAGPIVTTDLEGNLIGGSFLIDSGTSTIGGGLGISGQYYTNKDSNKGEYEDFHITGTDYVKLPAGTYCPMFSAQLAVSAAVGTGSQKMYLGTGSDEVQIIAHYYH